MKTLAALRSVGAYVPEKVLTNQDLEKIVETTDEWIIKRTGIKRRHIAAEGEVTSDLALKASERAIARAGISKEEIDLILVASISGDYLFMPSTACVLAHKLGLKGVPAFDLLAACSGFIYALSTARAYIESGAKKNVLVVGAELLSRFVDWEDRTTCVLFGDGAGAAVVSATDDESLAIRDVHLGADGEFQDFLITPGGGSVNPCSAHMMEERNQFIKMKGNETFKVAVRTLSNDVVEILKETGLEADAIKHFIPHQANYRIIKAVGDALKLRDDQVVLTVADYGNTSAASIPMAMNHIYEEGRLKKGDLMLLDAFGGGLTWGSALLPFAGEDLA